MKENFERLKNDDFHLNIQVTKIEPNNQIYEKTKRVSTLSDTKKKSLRDIAMNTKEIKRQLLKPEDLEFGNLPIQKLLPVQFVDCIESFSRIERSDNLIFINFKMKKKWIDFLIDRIQNPAKNHDNLISKQNQNETHIFIDISEMENNKIYNIYTITNNFRFMFSDQSLYTNIVCGKEYLSNYCEETNAVIPQKEIKKGLLNFIFKKWSN
jgi:hypothetical protein